MTTIRDIAGLEAIYGAFNQLAPAATAKVSSRITSQYQRFIEHSPFASLATVGPEGVDCSPRGDKPGFVKVVAPDKLLLPDRRGNNRIDSLRNVVYDPRVAVMFLIPGVNNVIRVNGRAHLDTDPTLLAPFTVEGKAPRSVMVIQVDEVYFQCARALIRSGLWSMENHVDPAELPTPGEILAELSQGEVGGEVYDQTWAERARKTMW